MGGRERERKENKGGVRGERKGIEKKRGGKCKSLVAATAPRVFPVKRLT